MLGILANVAGLEFGNISRRTLSGHARMARDGNTPAAGTAATKRGPVRTLDLRISPL